MSDTGWGPWIEWAGRSALGPVPPGSVVSIRRRDGCFNEELPCLSDYFQWKHDQKGGDIVAYRRILHKEQEEKPAAPKAPEGGKLTGDHYYRVHVPKPISDELTAYTAECADIIEALNMTFNEGEAFKALWRLASSRQGRGKPGNTAKYDADKVAHYGGRVAAQAGRASVK